ncbi:MAG TPA: AraC family transcriptional regulator [Candidatus Dorea gallistercoris]|uniref:AraC family transcriptional regulator n=1 Tax=Candidatus Dorea gallistercoris TaxID=2838542 RepID=A0A9D1UDP8_9FIRM|nr:AraC family transcriptional regulator [Candidatus Dorea gallistercoris]
MDRKLLEYLEEMNEQEQKILSEGKQVLDYFTKNSGDTVVDAEVVMRPMTLIDILKQPRFVDLPRHTHNYMEVVYMCSGSTTHVIDDGTEITLNTGELLFIQQGTSHSVSAAGYHDIAVRFVIRPAFLQYPLSMLHEDTVLRRFIERAAEDDRESGDYLQFHLQEMPEAENLLENMTRMLLKRRRNSRQILQATMGVLLLELSGRTYKITVGAPSSYEQSVVLEALNYIETQYQTASLGKFCAERNLPDYYISRLMKRYSPYTFTQYLQRRRLLQAAYMLTETKEPVENIIVAVGYENSSHFHRLFKETYGMTPKEYRKKYTMSEWPMFEERKKKP